MTFQSSLDERTVPVVADRRVVINLNATGCAEAILRACPAAVSSSKSRWSFGSVAGPVARMLTPLRC